MDIRTLRYFVEVVRQQSFTRAAEKLFVTQPTISKMLKNLEDELNCTLLIRDGRKLLLTDTGRVVFERGQAILGEFSQLESELSDINHLHKGVLRLGIPPMVGMLMAEPISRFRQRYPGVELKIAEFGGLTVQQAVSNGELDMAMTALPVEEDSSLTILPLFNHPLCVLTPRTAEWEGKTSLSPAELASHPLVIYNEEFALSQQLMRLFAEHDVEATYRGAQRPVGFSRRHGAGGHWRSDPAGTDLPASRPAEFLLDPVAKRAALGAGDDLAGRRIYVAQRWGLAGVQQSVLAGIIPW